MKVLFCSPYVNSPNFVKGGINTWGNYIVKHYEELQMEDFELIPISFDRTTLIAGLNSKFMQILRGIKDLLAPVIRTITNIIRSNPNVVHVCTSSGYGLIKDYIIIKFAQMYKVKTVVHLHFGRIPELCKEDNIEWKVLRKIIKMSNTTIVMNKPSEDVLKTQGFRNIINIPNPLGDSVFDQITRLGNIDRVPRNILYCGHVIKSKGVYELIEGCVGLSDIHLKIVGRVNQDVKQDLITIANKKGDTGWLEFLGEQPHDLVLYEFLRADLFVFPSYTEGFPNVILEAMACGCPIVASSVGAIPEMLDIKGTPCGVCISPYSSEDVFNAVNYLFANPDYKRQLSENAVKRVRENYSIKRVWDELLVTWTKTINRDIDEYDY